MQPTDWQINGGSARGETIAVLGAGWAMGSWSRSTGRLRPPAPRSPARV